MYVRIKQILERADPSLRDGAWQKRKPTVAASWKASVCGCRDGSDASELRKAILQSRFGFAFPLAASFPQLHTILFMVKVGILEKVKSIPFDSGCSSPGGEHR